MGDVQTAKLFNLLDLRNANFYDVTVCISLITVGTNRLVSLDCRRHRLSQNAFVTLYCCIKAMRNYLIVSLLNRKETLSVQCNVAA